MTLQEIINTIIHSQENDWNCISCWGHGSGPSYKNNFQFHNVYYGQENLITLLSHSDVCVFKSNISISIAYGLDLYDENEQERHCINEEWATNNPDPSPGVPSFADVFFNNGLIHRVLYCVVDGGRCKIPYPHRNNQGNYIVERQYYEFIKVLNEISGVSLETYRGYFDRTGITIVEEPWLD